MHQGAFQSDRLHIEMQPIMSIMDPGSSKNAEALLRGSDEQGLSVPAAKLIDMAHKSGQAAELDLWVALKVLAWMSEHQCRLSNTEYISINLSGNALNDAVFRRLLTSLLDRHQQIAPKVCLELTEGAAIGDFARIRSFMETLKARGVRFALDDFGTGFASYGHLNELPFDVLKIDGSLVRDMVGSEKNRAIIKSVSDLAHTLEMKSVAEWVEDVQTLRELREIGIDYVQGYLISKSRPMDDMLAASCTTELISNPEALEAIGQW